LVAEFTLGVTEGLAALKISPHPGLDFDGSPLFQPERVRA
jgi:hypothetical protein